MSSPFGATSVLLGGNKAPASYNPPQQLTPLMSMYMSMPKQASTSQTKPVQQTSTVNPAYQPQTQQISQARQGQSTQTSSFFDPRSQIYDNATYLKILNSAKNSAKEISTAPTNYTTNKVSSGMYNATTPQVYMPQTVQPGQFYNPTSVRPVLPTYFSH